MLAHEKVPGVAIAEVELSACPIQAQTGGRWRQAAHRAEAEDGRADERFREEGGQPSIGMNGLRSDTALRCGLTN